MVEWCDRTPEQKQVNREAKKRHRYANYAEVLAKEQVKNVRYREANREKLREKARERYVRLRELAGKPVEKEYKPRKPRDEEPPVVLPTKFGSLDKICTVTT